MVYHSLAESPRFFERFTESKQLGLFSDLSEFQVAVYLLQSQEMELGSKSFSMGAQLL